MPTHSTFEYAEEHQLNRLGLVRQKRVKDPSRMLTIWARTISMR